MFTLYLKHKVPVKSSGKVLGELEGKVYTIYSKINFFSCHPNEKTIFYV